MLSRYTAITLIVFVPDYRGSALNIHFKQYLLGCGSEWHTVEFDTFLAHIREWFLLVDNKKAPKTQ